MRLSVYPWDTAFRWILLTQLRAFLGINVILLYDSSKFFQTELKQEMLLPVTLKYAQPQASGNNLVELYHETDQHQYGEERKEVEWQHLVESSQYYTQFMEAK